MAAVGGGDVVVLPQGARRRRRRPPPGRARCGRSRGSRRRGRARRRASRRRGSAPSSRTGSARGWASRALRLGLCAHCRATISQIVRSSQQKFMFDVTTPRSCRVDSQTIIGGVGSAPGERGSGSLVTDVVLPQMGLEVSEGTVTAVLVAVGDTRRRGRHGRRGRDRQGDRRDRGAPRRRRHLDRGRGRRHDPGRRHPDADRRQRPTPPRPARRRRGGEAATADSSRPPADSSPSPPLPVRRPPRAKPRPPRRRPRPREPSGTATAPPPCRPDRPPRRLEVRHRPRADHRHRPRRPHHPRRRRARRRRARRAAPRRPAAGERLEPLSATRQAIARRLTESQLVPQYTLSRDVDATWLLAEKTRLSAEGPAKVGVVDLLVQALARDARPPPAARRLLRPRRRRGAGPATATPSGIDVGLAVATDRGLLVPVIRGAHERTLPELVLERARLIETTRSGRLGLGRHDRRRGDALQPRDLRRRQLHGDAQPRRERDPRRRADGRASRPPRPRPRRGADPDADLHLRPPGRRRRHRRRRPGRAGGPA